MVNEAKNIIKNNLLLAYIINNIFAIKKFYITAINKKANDTHKKNILESIFYDKLYFNNSFIILKKVRIFINQLYNQISIFY